MCRSLCQEGTGLWLARCDRRVVEVATQATTHVHPRPRLSPFRSFALRPWLNSFAQAPEDCTDGRALCACPRACVVRPVVLPSLGEDSRAHAPGSRPQEPAGAPLPNQPSQAVPRAVAEGCGVAGLWCGRCRLTGTRSQRRIVGGTRRTWPTSSRHSASASTGTSSTTTTYTPPHDMHHTITRLLLFSIRVTLPCWAVAVRCFCRRAMLSRGVGIAAG